MNTNIKSRLDYEKIAAQLDLIDLKYKNCDVWNNPVYIAQTEQYGGVTVLPIVVYNGINLGGLDNINDLIDMRILHDLSDQK